MVSSFVDTLTTAIKLSPERYRIYNEGNLGLRPLATTGVGRTLSNGTDTSASSQAKVTQRISGHSIRLQYNNHTNSGTSSAEAPNTNAVTYKAALLLSVSGGVPTPFTFAGGQTSGTAQPGGILISDPLEVDIPQGTDYWIITYVSVASAGMKWCTAYSGNAGRNEGNIAAVDYTATTSGIPTYSNTAMVAPAHILGVPSVGARSAIVGCLGDSIMRGNSQITDVMGLNILTPLSQTATVQIAAYGETVAGFVKIDGHRLRVAQLAGCTSWHSNYGTNDLASGTPVYATVAANLLRSWQIAYDRVGVPGYQWTLGPRTTSTDSWATVGNQTIQFPTSNGIRVQINAWIRDGAPILAGTPVAVGSNATGTLRAGQAGHPLAGYYEVADVVESARDSGLFKAAYSFDGVHFTPAAYTAVAAALDWTKLGIV